MSGLAGLGLSLLGKLSGVGGFFKPIGKALGKIPWQFWAALGAAVAIWIGIHAHQTAVNRVRSAAYAQGSKDTSQAFLAAQAKADAAALKQKQDMEAHYAALASQKDREYETQLADAQQATARYIATHSVRQSPDQGRPGTTVTTADNHGPGVPQGLPSTSVVVSADDVQACTSAVTYGIAAHNWSLGLKP